MYDRILFLNQLFILLNNIVALILFTIMTTFPTIETSRLILKLISSEEMFRIFNSLPQEEVMKILGHRTVADYEKEYAKHLGGYSTYNRKFIMFFLIDKQSGLIIGRCGIHNWNKDHRRAEIGYHMEDESFKQKGLMSEAVKAVIAYAFRELNLNRLEAMAGVDNVPSLRIIEKNGFTKEGRLRQHVVAGEHFQDSFTFSILASEYYENI